METKLAITTPPTPHGILARLWINTIKDNSLEYLLNDLIKLYLDRHLTKDGKKPKSAISKDVSSKELSWKKYTWLVFNLINVNKIDLTMELKLEGRDNIISSVNLIPIAPNFTKTKRDANDPHVVLAKLWSKISDTVEVSSNSTVLVDNYLTSWYSEATVSVRSKAKSTILNDLSNEKITWKKLINLLVRFLRILDVTICVKLTRPNDSITYHSVMVNTKP